MGEPSPKLNSPPLLNLMGEPVFVNTLTVILQVNPSILVTVICPPRKCVENVKAGLKKITMNSIFFILRKENESYNRLSTNKTIYFSPKANPPYEVQVWSIPD